MLVFRALKLDPVVEVLVKTDYVNSRHRVDDQGAASQGSSVGGGISSRRT